MRQAIALLFLVLVTDTYSAPQFLIWKDGKLGVNFGGYHASVGVGLPGGSGGLYAEAGTPTGQNAIAGIGGSMGNKYGHTGGGLFAGATAGQNVHASAGLSGITGNNGVAHGHGFASAQAGNNVATSGLGGQTSAAGSTGYKFSGTQTYGIPTTVVKETEVSVGPVEDKPLNSENKKVHTEFKLETDNEIKPLPLSPVAEAHFDAKVDVKDNAEPAVVVKDVFVEPQPHIIEKTKIKTHYKPHHHHVHKTAYIGGYVGGGADVPQPSYQTIEKRIDVGHEGSENVEVRAGGHGGGQTTYTKQVTVEKNPTFYQDIFNIPISALQAVGSFLSNSAANTKVSVQKSATVEAETDAITSKHAPLSSSSKSSESEARISVQTPSVSKIIDDIFAIPINTLGAVNRFLDNNVSARKRIQVQDGSGEPTRVRLGPHARRRANKQVIVVQQENSNVPIPNEDH